MSQIAVGWPEGRRRYTGAGENLYERRRRGGAPLSASEYVHVLPGLRDLPTVDPAATTTGGPA